MSGFRDTSLNVTHGRRIDVQSFDVRVGSCDEGNFRVMLKRREESDSMSLVTVVEYNKTSVGKRDESYSSYIL